MSRPVLLFDGDCAFCTSSAQLVQRRIGPEAEIVAWQFADLEQLGVTEEQASEAVQWVGPDGSVRSGHEAIAAMLSTSGPLWRVAGRVLLLPESPGRRRAPMSWSRPTVTGCREARPPAGFDPLVPPKKE